MPLDNSFWRDKTLQNLTFDAANRGVTVETVDGEAMIDGRGEAVVTVRFPLRFIEKPIFYFGGEMRPGQGLVPGHYPRLNATIIEWTLDEIPPYRRHYLGATIATLIDGHDGIKMFLHWSFTGKALKDMTYVDTVIEP